jgi:hypothetical protein
MQAYGKRIAASRHNARALGKSVTKLLERNCWRRSHDVASRGSRQTPAYPGRDQQQPPDDLGPRAAYRIEPVEEGIHSA